MNEILQPIVILHPDRKQIKQAVESLNAAIVELNWRNEVIGSLLAALRNLMAEGVIEGGVWRVDLSVNGKALTEARVAIAKAEEVAP